MHVPSPRVSTESVTTKTVKQRSFQLSSIQKSISGGESSERIQLQSEIKLLSTEDREKLLDDIGIHSETSAEQGLALKADLSIPWNKLRVMRRSV